MIKEINIWYSIHISIQVGESFIVQNVYSSIVGFNVGCDWKQVNWYIKVSSSDGIVIAVEGDLYATLFYKDIGSFYIWRKVYKIEIDPETGMVN